MMSRRRALLGPGLLCTLLFTQLVGPLGCQRSSTTSAPEPTPAPAVDGPPVSAAQQSASGPFALVELFTSEG